SNPYEYPSDPVNKADLDGRLSCKLGLEWPPSVTTTCAHRKLLNRRSTRLIIRKLKNFQKGLEYGATGFCPTFGFAAGGAGAAMCAAVTAAILASAWYYEALFRRMTKKSGDRGTVFRVSKKMKVSMWSHPTLGPKIRV
ncbi:MAG: hypothetical protein ACPGYP_08980, partial [Solirubrobacterales bacterium]